MTRRAMAAQALKRVSNRKDLYELGEIPPLGHVPAKMYAWAIRKERHGPPEEAMQIEVVPTWPIGDDEVLVLVMAAGVNYNGVWAALGQPVSTLDVHKQPYHVAGSDASGIVWAVGSKVKRKKVGDEVVVQDRKSTRLNSSHANISYAVFCLKKKKSNLLINPRRF